jgi:hypothetical protein
MKNLVLILLVIGLSDVTHAQSPEQKFGDAIVNVLLQQHRLSGDDVSYWREWNSATRRILNKQKLNSFEARKYLLVVFAANEGDLTQTSEYISQTIVKRFVDNSPVLLGALNSMRFADKAFCRAVSDHFDLFSNDDEEEAFLRSNLELSEICGILK